MKKIPSNKSRTRKHIKKSPAPKKTAKTKRAGTKKKKALKAATGFPELLKKAALKVLDDRQADNIVTADLRGKSALADYAIVASGRSNRQVAAMADHLQKTFLEHGVRKIRVEGLPQGDWVLIDAGDVLVHLFRPEVRRYYNIEDIWSHKPRGA